MNFLVLVHPYPPTPSSGAHRWGGIVKYLRREGHDVRVITSGAFGRLDDPDDERGVVRTADLMASARLRRLAGLPPLAEPGSGGGGGADLPPALTKFVVPDPFLLSWAPMALRAAWWALSERPADCVITSSPNESTHLVGRALRRRFDHAWIVDLRDGWTFERFLPDFPTRAQRSLNAGLERSVVRRADAVTAATRPIADDLRTRHGVEVEHVPNAWDPDLEPPAPAEPAANGHIRLVHTGMISGGWGRDPRALFAGLHRLLDEQPELRERVRLVIAGGLSETDTRLIEREKLGGIVTNVGYVPRDEALRMQRAADTLILVTSGHAGEATGKVYEYLAAGRPILALAAGNEAARIVEETGTGVAVDPSDGEAVLAALRAAVEGRLRYEPRGLDTYRQPAPARRIAEIAERALRR